MIASEKSLRLMSTLTERPAVTLHEPPATPAGQTRVAIVAVRVRLIVRVRPATRICGATGLGSV